MAEDKKITTSTGCPMGYGQYENSQTAGPRGPVLLQDFFLQEKNAHFNRERTPERVVHAKGSGAFGVFKVTKDITQYTRAKLFNQVGKETPMFARFSTVGGEMGSADTERDPRGFALKFYTEDGNWDLVGNNTPVFFIKDAKKFPDFIHTQKRDPKTNLKSQTMRWDFWSLNPESLHQVLILMSDRGTPDGYRHMHGFGSHTFSLVNEDNERVYVKFHLKTQQGIKNFDGPSAEKMKGADDDYAQRDLVNEIENGNFPKWTMKIQVMTIDQARDFRWNPFDVTKVWPHADFPLIEVGEMTLNKIPENYFRDVEQSAFAPTNVIDGIGFSPDKMLQGRIFAYPDAHRYRIGVNFDLLEVNKPKVPVHNYHQNGAMRVDDNGGSGPNYYPNSFDGATEDKNRKGEAYDLEDATVGYYDRNENDDDHYTQPGNLFDKVMYQQEQQATINNIVEAMSGIDGPKKMEIINRQLCHWFRASPQLGAGIAKGLGVDVSQFMPK